jgi:WD40 repeat protein
MRDVRWLSINAIVALGVSSLFGWAAARAPAPRPTEQPMHQRTGPFTVAGEPDQLAVSTDGSFVLVHDHEHNITLFRPDGSLIRRLPETLPLTALLSDGKTLVAYKKGRFLSYNLPDGKQISERETSDVVWFLAFGRGDVLVGCCPHKYTLGNEDWTVRLWQHPGGKELSSFEVKGTDMYDTVVSGDGSLFAWDGGNDVIHVWDCRAGKELARFEHKSSSVVHLAFSPHGKYLATGAENRICIWDLKTKKLFHRLDSEKAMNDGRTFYIQALAFAPDGSTLASGGNDYAVSFWDVKTGKLLRKTGGDPGEVVSIAFFPDGKTVVAGHSDEVLRLWEVSTGKEITPGAKAKKD